MPTWDGQLLVYDETELLEVLAEPLEQKLTFYHQTTDLTSIRKHGWDPTARSGQRRLYGDGVYLAMPAPFWPDKPGRAVVSAKLRLAGLKAYQSTDEVATELREAGLNNQSDAAQAAIRRYFLDSKVTCISFPEDIGPDATLNYLNGTPNQTFVVYDPSIIFVVGVRE